MARILIVGCGCRGQALAHELRKAGHTVRGTTRNPNRRKEIEATGAEAYLADPDRIGTLTPALDGVTIVCLLLGSATGTHDHVKALHTTRLETLLQRTIDTTIQGFIYEAQGTVGQDILHTGAKRVQATCTHNRIPYRILHTESDRWLAEATSAIDALLARP
jgi:uncharacterized protein YbjT (DUF2867 family)